MKKLFLFMLCFICSLAGIAQTNLSKYPEVGKPCPNFILHNIAYFSKKEATLSDFKGKWLVLDFWTTDCGGCIASFPRTSAMQKKFSDRVQFMLVGIQDKENKIGLEYATFRKRENLVMPCAFDSVLSNHWGIYNCPHILVIDDKGIVRAVTMYVENEDIQDFLDGKQPVLEKAYLSQNDDAPPNPRIYFDDKKPFLINGNGGSDTDFLFRSVLARFNPTVVPYTFRGFYSNLSSFLKVKGVFTTIGATIEDLYRYAYLGNGSDWSYTDTLFYGKYYYKPILLIKDSSLFQYDYSVRSLKNIFSYSLTIPASQASDQRFKQVMQNDLKNYFGYEVTVEVRKFPVLRLVATDVARMKLKTKGKDHREDEEVPQVTVNFQNIPMRRLILLINARLKEPIIDETGINSNIDITMNYFNVDEIEKSLHKNGLDLVKGEKEMKVLVIRDPKPEVSAAQ